MIILQPGIEKAYIANNNTRTLTNGELFLGYQSALPSGYLSQLGIVFAFTDLVKFTGNIWEDADPDFNNFYYRYDAVYSHIAVKAKFLKQWTETLAPYVAASVGVGFNRASRFEITPIIYEEIPAPPFTDNTLYNAFAYTFEVGLQHTITQHWFGGIGYNFADWGRTALGRARGQTSDNGIQLKHFYTNGLQFSLTYLA